ncbi:uncharacterized protein [Choristoneura fumiferana]|uniref:uncharacterized protein n=1 Tax=Choristoneura fumiferana TaxID=7141 RepID=UPI003D15537D
MKVVAYANGWISGIISVPGYVSAGWCGNASALAAALPALLAEYERGAAPAQPVAARAALDLRHAAVDERASVVRMLADLHLYWSDQRLAWNASEWDCETTLVPAEALWLPDVELLNGASGASGAGGAGGDGSLRARLSAAGDVEWIKRIDVAVPLALDLRAWPRDLQTAVFKFGSREHTADELDLRISDYKYATVWESGSWLIESVRGAEEAARRVVAWRLALRRRAAAHALAGAAVLATAVLLLIAAAAQPQSRRAPLCACAAFTAALWLISALLRLPGSSTYPELLVAMGGVCGVAGAWSCAAALAARLARLPGPVPPRLAALVLAAPPCCSLPEDDGGSAWAAPAQLLDNVLRALLAVTLLVLVCLAL